MNHPLTDALNNHNIFDKFQYGFHQKHYTETALLRVSNDIMMSSDAGKCSVLVLFNFSAAFDTVDHNILIERLREGVGISGRTLYWFSPYLSDRSFSVAIGPYMSESAALFCGVPQGSVLGPILFAFYLLCLASIISKFKAISYHSYADDIQLYFSFKPDQLIDNLNHLYDCLSAVKDGMASNFLQLNTDKSELLIVAADSTVSKVANSIGLLNSIVLSNLKNLGVIFDQVMNLDKHVKHLPDQR